MMPEESEFCTYEQCCHVAKYLMVSDDSLVMNIMMVSSGVVKISIIIFQILVSLYQPHPPPMILCLSAGYMCCQETHWGKKDF